MNPIAEKVALLKKVRLSFLDIASGVIQQERDFINTLNRNQLLDGVKADGSTMPDYAESNTKTGAINLFDTGAFQGGIGSMFENDDEFKLMSTDDKTDILISKYGNILGLNQQSLTLLRNRIKPLILNKVRSLL